MFQGRKEIRDTKVVLAFKVLKVRLALRDTKEKQGRREAQAHKDIKEIPDRRDQ